MSETKKGSPHRAAGLIGAWAGWLGVAACGVAGIVAGEEAARGFASSRFSMAAALPFFAAAGLMLALMAHAVLLLNRISERGR